MLRAAIRCPRPTPRAIASEAGLIVGVAMQVCGRLHEKGYLRAMNAPRRLPDGRPLPAPDRAAEARQVEEHLRRHGARRCASGESGLPEPAPLSETLSAAGRRGAKRRRAGRA